MSSTDETVGESPRALGKQSVPSQSLDVLETPPRIREEVNPIISLDKEQEPSHSVAQEFVPLEKGVKFRESVSEGGVKSKSDLASGKHTGCSQSGSSSGPAFRVVSSNFSGNPQRKSVLGSKEKACKSVSCARSGGHVVRIVSGGKTREVRQNSIFPSRLLINLFPCSLPCRCCCGHRRELRRVKETNKNMTPEEGRYSYKNGVGIMKRKLVSTDNNNHFEKNGNLRGRYRENNNLVAKSLDDSESRHTLPGKSISSEPGTLKESRKKQKSKRKRRSRSYDSSSSSGDSRHPGSLSRSKYPRLNSISPRSGDRHRPRSSKKSDRKSSSSSKPKKSKKDRHGDSSIKRKSSKAKKKKKRHRHRRSDSPPKPVRASQQLVACCYQSESGTEEDEPEEPDNIVTDGVPSATAPFVLEPLVTEPPVESLPPPPVTPTKEIVPKSPLVSEPELPESHTEETAVNLNDEDTVATKPNGTSRTDSPIPTAEVPTELPTVVPEEPEPVKPEPAKPLETPIQDPETESEELVTSDTIVIEMNGIHNGNYSQEGVTICIESIPYEAASTVSPGLSNSRSRSGSRPRSATKIHSSPILLGCARRSSRSPSSSSSSSYRSRTRSTKSYKSYSSRSYSSSRSRSRSSNSTRSMRSDRSRSRTRSLSSRSPSRSRSKTRSSRSRTRSRSRSVSKSKTRSYSRSPSRSNSRSPSRSKSRSPIKVRKPRDRSASIPRRRGSPSFLDKRRITSARKRPIPYKRKAGSEWEVSSETESSDSSF